jgi:hypothetical protein
MSFGKYKSGATDRKENKKKVMKSRGRKAKPAQ